VAWSVEGLSSRKIAGRLRWDKTTINRIINNTKQLEEGAIPVRKEVSGRPRKMSRDMLLVLKGRSGRILE
jgi:transposase